MQELGQSNFASTLDGFENYVKSNYNIPNATACSIKYTFTSRESTDKISKIPVIMYTVVMKMTWFDKYGQQLHTDKFIFVNDNLAKSSEKSCLTIAPGETTNRFRVAKPEIIRSLLKTKQEKIDELKQEQSLLTRYLGTNNAIIPNAMKPTGTIGSSAVERPVQVSPTNKNRFEM